MGSGDATARRIAVSRGSEAGGLYRPQRAQIGGDRVEIGGRELLVPTIRQTVGAPRPVWADAGGGRAFLLAVAPFAPGLLRVGGDVGGGEPPRGRGPTCRDRCRPASAGRSPCRPAGCRSAMP